MNNQSEQTLDSLVEGLEAKGFEIDVLDRKKIQKQCGADVYNRLGKALPRVKQRKFRFSLMEEELKIVWPSDARPGWLVINFAHSAKTPELIEMINKAEEELQQVDLAAKELGVE